MQINKERLWNHLQELANIGKNENGSITRFPFTKEDLMAQDLIVKWMQEAHLEVEIDAVGNIIGTLQGKDPTLSAVMSGSHMDTVKEGGMFDGCLGVLAAIEVLQSMHEQHIVPLRRIKAIAFKDEEGNRFGYGMVGSKSMAGVFDRDGFNSLDENGITLAEAMKSSGFKPDLYMTCKQIPHHFYELHIEQAKVLENRQYPIGIVEGIAGLLRYTITINGESAHAGATPMSERIDPVVAMSHWIMEMETWAKCHDSCVATVGSIQTFPGACNVICEQVRFSLDFRSINAESMNQVKICMEQLNEQLEETYQVTINVYKEQEISPCLCDQLTQKQLQGICEDHQINTLFLMSGAGHDCMNFYGLCAINMIFVRSHQGYSHRKEEFSSKEDCALGTQVLYEIILKSAFD